MKIVQTAIPSCYLIEGEVYHDARGDFRKIFNHDILAGFELRSGFLETYVTRSKYGVIRGMHFQLPPSEHVKLVSCISGSAVDVLVDLRIGSPVYGEPMSLHLNHEKLQWVYIPIGVAHGFVAVSDDTCFVYHVTSVYDPKADAGISWDSFGFDWDRVVSEYGREGDFNPILSERDRNFPSLADFTSPFLMENDRCNECS